MRRICKYSSTKCVDEWLQGMRLLARATNQLGVTLIVVSPLPDFRPQDSGTSWNIIKETCTRQWFRPTIDKECQMTRARQEILESLKEIKDGLSMLRSEFKNVLIYDPLPAVCPRRGMTCSNYLGNKKIYVDTNHLNYFGASLFSKDFSRFLPKNRIVDLDK